MLPAPAQGALAIECVAERAPELAAALDGVHDAVTAACVRAERALLTALEAGCSAPLGAIAETVEGKRSVELSLRAVAVDLGGTASIRTSATGPIDHPEALGERVAAALLDQGAADLVGLALGRQPAAGGTRR
jgi:hydroxymethylbilane synthase